MKTYTIGDVVESLPMFPTLSESIKLTALSFTKDIIQNELLHLTNNTPKEGKYAYILWILLTPAAFPY
jgi:hypothetical protein